MDKVWALLGRYSFQIVCLGTMVLALAGAMLGTITVLKGQSLIGDAIGHASYPGLVLAFMLAMALDPVLLLVGAIATGSLAFLLIQWMDQKSKLPLDSILALVLSGFFGLGMVLKSYIQGHPVFAQVAQGGLENYIFGQAAFLRLVDVKLILAVALPALALLFLFYKEFKVFLFDETYARTMGIRTSWMYALMVLLIMGVIATGLKAVGAILISSFLIVPALSALQWSGKYKLVLALAGAFGVFSAGLGTLVSSLVAGFSTGPSIILIMSLIAFFSMLFGPRGILAKKRNRRSILNGK